MKATEAAVQARTVGTEAAILRELGQVPAADSLVRKVTDSATTLFQKPATSESGYKITDPAREVSWMCPAMDVAVPMQVTEVPVDEKEASNNRTLGIVTPPLCVLAPLPPHRHSFGKSIGRA